MGAVVSQAIAEQYFALRFNNAAWVDLGSDNGKKEAVLTSATVMLEAMYDLDITQEKHRNAVLEQAYFLLTAGEGADMREGLRTMGVTETDVNKEKYALGGNSLMICGYAKFALAGSELGLNKTFAKTRDIVRDDE